MQQQFSADIQWGMYYYIIQILKDINNNTFTEKEMAKIKELNMEKFRDEFFCNLLWNWSGSDSFDPAKRYLITISDTAAECRIEIHTCSFQLVLNGCAKLTKEELKILLITQMSKKEIGFEIA